MSRRDLIDPDLREPLDQLLQAIPGDFNSIPDSVQRGAAMAQLLAGSEVRHDGVDGRAAGAGRSTVTSS